MNYIDGGMWQYGDDSAPISDTTFFAGTFCKHPLALAAAKAVLSYLQAQGPTLQIQLNHRTTHFISRLNHYFEQSNLPIQLVNCGSLFNVVPTDNCQPTNSAFNPQSLDLIYYHLIDSGIFIRSVGGALSTAHTDEDLDSIVQALKNSLECLKMAGFLPTYQVTSRYFPDYDVPDYDPFAKFYNEYWGEQYCKKDLPVFEQLLLSNIHEASPILELGCGTGHLAQKLLLKGYAVTGIDQSQAMLNFAHINAPAGQFIQLNLTHLDFSPSFAGVFSTSVLNHLMNFEDLSHVFCQVYNALFAGGVFVFNLTQEEQYLSNWRGYVDQGDVQTEFAWASKVSYDPETQIGQIEMFIFELMDGQWQRTETVWPVKYHPKDAVIAALEKAGFINIKVYDAERDLGFSVGVGEAFFVCWKPQ